MRKSVPVSCSYTCKVTFSMSKCCQQLIMYLQCVLVKTKTLTRSRGCIKWWVWETKRGFTCFLNTDVGKIVHDFVDSISKYNFFNEKVLNFSKIFHDIHLQGPTDKTSTTLHEWLGTYIPLWDASLLQKVTHMFHSCSKLNMSGYIILSA